MSTGDLDVEYERPLWGEDRVGKVSQMEWECTCGAQNTIFAKDYVPTTTTFETGNDGYHAVCPECGEDFCIQLPIHKYAGVINKKSTQDIVMYMEERNVQKEGEGSWIINHVDYILRKARDAFWRDGVISQKSFARNNADATESDDFKFD